jgi:uncharacterized protein (TIGR04222 family)
MPTLLESVGNLPGPEFLAVYLAVIFVTLAVVWTARWYTDSSRWILLPEVAPNPDPYELAWLRGGEAEVLRLAIFSLLERGLLTKADDNRIGQASVDQAALNGLVPLELALFEHFAVPQSAGELFRGDAPWRLRDACLLYGTRMEGEQFLITSKMRLQRVFNAMMGGLVIVGLGAFKLDVALSRHKTNVGLLIALAALSCIALILLARSGRLSARGKSYLDRLKVAYGGLTRSADEPAEGESRFDPNVLLYAGLFGVGALGASYLLDYRELFPRMGAHSGSSSGSCGGASCGSCGASASSSCGGGSGCGGGSCGGGCGGCGGGCGG